MENELADSWPTVGRLLVDCRSTVSRQLTDALADVSTDASTDALMGSYSLPFPYHRTCVCQKYKITTNLFFQF